MVDSTALMKDAAAALARAGIEEPMLEAQVMLAHCLTVERHLLAVDPRPVDDEVAAGFWRMVERRRAREPLAYIIGNKEFWSLDFAVGPGVLIPRPETETVVEEALLWAGRDFSGRVLDLGCGSGALAVVLARELPAATVVAVDRSPDALAYCVRNAARHGVAGRVLPVLADWCEAFGCRFPLVVANPPYVDRADAPDLAPELAYEPDGALFSGNRGLADAERILAAMGRVLAPGGCLFMEIGCGQDEAVLRMAMGCGWCASARVARDLAGIGRVLVAERNLNP